MQRVTVTVKVADSKATRTDEVPIETSASMMIETAGIMTETAIAALFFPTALRSLYDKAREDLEA